MKFQMEVRGKDSISEGCTDATWDIMKNSSVSDDDYEDEAEKIYKQLKNFVRQFIVEGEGGDDYVNVEFDTEAGTCTVIPLVKKVKMLEIR